MLDMERHGPARAWTFLLSLFTSFACVTPLAQATELRLLDHAFAASSQNDALITATESLTLVHWFIYLVLAMLLLSVAWWRTTEKPIWQRLLLRSSTLLMLFVPLASAQAPFLLILLNALPVHANDFSVYVIALPLILFSLFIWERRATVSPLRFESDQERGVRVDQSVPH